MFEITLDEMIYVLAQDMGLTDDTRFIDRTDRIPQKPFNQDMQPLKRPEKKQETGAARDIAAEEQQPKQQKSPKKKERVQPAKEESSPEVVEQVNGEAEEQPKQQKPSKKKEKEQPAKKENDSGAVEHLAGDVEKQPSVSPAPEKTNVIESITKMLDKDYSPLINAVYNAVMDSMPGIKEEYVDEANAAMNVGNGSITQQQTPQEHVTTTPTSPTQVGVNDVVSKFVTPHARQEKLTPKNVYGDALANGKEYTQQIQQTQQTQNQQQVAALDVNAINSYISSLPMDEKDKYIRGCCMDEYYPDMKGLVQTTVASKVERLKEICDFLPPEQGGGGRSLYSINLQSILFALTGKYVKRIMAKNGIPENTKFKEIHSNHARFRFAFVAEGEKASVIVYVNPVPVLTQYTDDAGNVKYSWNVDTAVETINKTA